jgi:hypothetical protein
MPSSGGLLSPGILEIYGHRSFRPFEEPQMARAICLLGTFATLFVNVPSLNAATVVSGGVIVSPDEEGGLGDYFFGVAQKADDVDPHDTRGAST